MNSLGIFFNFRFNKEINLELKFLFIKFLLTPSDVLIDVNKYSFNLFSSDNFSILNGIIFFSIEFIYFILFEMFHCRLFLSYEWAEGPIPRYFFCFQ